MGGVEGTFDDKRKAIWKKGFQTDRDYRQRRKRESRAETSLKKYIAGMNMGWVGQPIRV